jgi:HAD superfamily hydrolase (TIGR01490 family)
MASMHPQKPFAVFDIDGTLIRWQLFHAIVHSLGKHGFLPAGAHERIHQARMAWKQRTTDTGFSQYESVLVNEYLAALKGISPMQYSQIVDDVFTEYKDQTFTYTRDLVRKLKAEGYMLLAISGSQHEIIAKLAAHHGFDAAVGATLEQIDGAFSGKVTTPIFDKASALKQLITAHNLTTKGSYAVGDSSSDISMLELVDHPIAFNPDKAFFATASARQWAIVVERKNMVYQLQPTKEGAYIWTTYS